MGREQMQEVEGGRGREGRDMARGDSRKERNRKGERRDMSGAGRKGEEEGKGEKL